MKRLTLLLATASCALLGAAATAHAAVTGVAVTSPAPGTAVTSNYPLLAGTVAPDWSTSQLLVGTKVDVDADGKLTTTTASVPLTPAAGAWSTRTWAKVAPTHPLFPGTYFVQADGSHVDPATGAVVEGGWTNPRRLVVRRVVGVPKVFVGKEKLAGTVLTLPITVSLSTNVRTVPLHFSLKFNGRSACRNDAPMVFKPGVDSRLARTLSCRIDFSTARPEGKNVIAVAVSMGSVATNGRVVADTDVERF